MLQIVLWKWKQAGFRVEYKAEHVNIVTDQIKRHIHDMPHRIVLVTDDPKGVDTSKCDVHPLWDDHNALPNRSGDRLPSCYRRLKLFDPETQKAMGITEGDRIASVDLDTIFANDLRPLFVKSNPFVGWAVRGTHHLRVFNGSMWMFTAGQLTHMWRNFDPQRTPDRCHKAGYMGSDQSWLSYNFAKDPTAGTWSYPQAVSYPREVQKRPLLSKGTSVVFFHGKRKPWEPEVHRESAWASLHWRPGTDPINPATVHVVARPGKVTATTGAANAVATN